MNYDDTLNYLFQALPMFQHIGGAAYKEGLENSIAFDSLLGHPHRQFRSIHIAGTNGKGSTSHLLAAILQSEGYRVGLYTSPHLLDFRERIRINGVPISEDDVVRFVNIYRSFFDKQQLSFFEMTTGLAFYSFAKANVDFAIVEVGLGGRLDCTNIISPILSIITNISFDHVQFLGDSLELIAKEKAGIIKPNTPVVIGEQGSVGAIFAEQASSLHAPITFAERCQPVTEGAHDLTGWSFKWRDNNITLKTPLGGFAQERNANTVLSAIEVLREIGVKISNNAVKNGFEDVVTLTGLRGRWEKLQTHPTVICDTGHNVGGFEYIVPQLKAFPCQQLRIVFGMVNDKEIDGVLKLLPKNALYYFTQASVSRALKSSILQEKGAMYGLKGNVYDSVSSAVKQALADCSPMDCIFIGGSTFVVADALKYYERVRTTS